MSENRTIRIPGVESTFSELELEYLLDQPRTTLTPSEFLFVFKYEQRQKGYEGTGRKPLNVDADLRDIYDELVIEKVGKKISGNMFVKAVRKAELKCSNERAKKLVALWQEGEDDDN